MVFNSLQFLLFFVLVTLLYYVIKPKYRWILLLIASCYFYMAFKPIYILILGGTIVIDYYAGLFIEKTDDAAKRKRLLILSLITNVGVLCVFKYYNFFIDNFNYVLNQGPGSFQFYYLKILLPIGLSFHTFQAMSYTIEVYRRKQAAEKHFGIYALYVMYYPQLVAGPIERPQNVLYQFHEKHRLDYLNIKNGLMQMAWGMFKKVVIADRLSILVDPVYNNPERYPGGTLILATVLYSFQIYCDFSGYSDIGIGAARTMGVKLMTNFRAPYLSRSVSEFWTRWHISLSTWFKDYVYIPLGGNRVPVKRWMFNLMVVFLISGLWHGADWKFVVWGALHGVFMIIEYFTRKKHKGKEQPVKPGPVVVTLQLLLTFALVSFAWIFFRAGHFSTAMYIAGHLFTDVRVNFSQLALNGTELAFAVMLLAAMMVKEGFSVHLPVRNTWAFALVFFAICFCCYFFGIFDNKQFIYFQF